MYDYVDTCVLPSFSEILSLSLNVAIVMCKKNTKKREIRTHIHEACDCEKKNREHKSTKKDETRQRKMIALVV